jgi:hypothetical protein
MRAVNVMMDRRNTLRTLRGVKVMIIGFNFDRTDVSPDTKYTLSSVSVIILRADYWLTDVLIGS